MQWNTKVCRHPVCYDQRLKCILLNCCIDTKSGPQKNVCAQLAKYWLQQFSNSESLLIASPEDMLHHVSWLSHNSNTCAHNCEIARATVL